MIEDLRVLGDCDINDTGSKVSFKADPEIFTETTVYDFETLRSRIQQLAFLNKGLRITIRDLRDEANKQEFSYHYEGGIVEYAKFLDKDRNQIAGIGDNVIYAEGVDEKQTFPLKLQFIIMMVIVLMFYHLPIIFTPMRVELMRKALC